MDTYGHVLDAAFVFHQLTGALGELRWSVLRRLIDAYSALMLWVCLDRGILLAEDLADDAGRKGSRALDAALVRVPWSRSPTSRSSKPPSTST